jgi:Flp pilus assembly protein CpaB
MDDSEVEHPRSAAISHSAQQFRQLILSLRNRKNHPLPEVNPSTNSTVLPNSNEKQTSSFTSTAMTAPSKAEDSALRLKPKLQVGGRDTLRKIPV